MANLSNKKTVEFFGPIISPMPKRQARYRCQLLIQTNHRGDLHKLLANTLPLIEKIKVSNKVRWSLDIDPMDMD
jgi:primosomal protein N' (replication factor Y) (superfamily II helicase)